MDSYFSQKQLFEVKTRSFCLLLILTGGLETYGLLVDYSDVFILTAPIHCRASIGEQGMECYISPNPMKKQTYLHLGWPSRFTYT